MYLYIKNSLVKGMLRTMAVVGVSLSVAACQSNSIRSQPSKQEIKSFLAARGIDTAGLAPLPPDQKGTEGFIAVESLEELDKSKEFRDLLARATSVQPHIHFIEAESALGSHLFNQLKASGGDSLLVERFHELTHFGLGLQEELSLSQNGPDADGYYPRAYYQRTYGFFLSKKDWFPPELLAQLHKALEEVETHFVKGSH